MSLELDASLQGFVARLGLQVNALAIHVGYLEFNIVHLQIVNFLAVIGVWGNQWAHKKVSIACDNEEVVQVLATGKTRELTLAATAIPCCYP